jgi:NAD-reducing hydrogenase large subunit
MSKTIIIDPVTRIEGHAKISIYLDDQGEVSEARFHVGEFRGFEKFCEGRPFWEMPALTSRICGICPVSHLIASSKTGDQLLAVQIPPGAEKLRRMINLAQITQSHALSFFHLSSPDLIFGWDGDPKTRNVFGLIAADPDLARGGIRLRKFGQDIIKILGGQKVHPAWSIPGGVRSPLTVEGQTYIKEGLPEAKNTVLNALTLFKKILDSHQEETAIFGNFPSLYLGLVSESGAWEHYAGNLRMIDSKGNVVGDRLNPNNYREFLGEKLQEDSYLKSPYYKLFGETGVYRVGPLARLNICEYMGTELADQELREYRQRHGRIVQSSFLYHHARLIEILTSLEHIEAMIDDPDLFESRLQAEAGVNQLEAVGISEAPRGTLFHHYQVDENGLLKKINLVIATGQNNFAINRTVTQIAQHYIHGEDVKEGILNRVEAGVRNYDPCLSCSTHAAGQMPMVLSLIAPDGKVIKEIRRDI